MKKYTTKPRHLMPFWRNPRLRYGSLSTLLICLTLAALIILNVSVTSLEKKYGWRVDYSFNALTTHSEKTLEILAQLEHPVHIYALYAKGQEDAPLMELLDRYTAASPLVTWEQTDVSLNPGLLTRFRGSTAEDVIANDSLIVFCEATGRWKVLSPVDFISLSLDFDTGSYAFSGLTYESKITSAISYVTRSDIPRVLLLQGHNELDAGGTAVLAELLENNHFEVHYGSLSSFDLQPDDLLALLSPTRDLTDSELQTITAFTAQGGSLLFTCDYSDPVAAMPNYAALMRSYGFLPMEGIVVASAQEPDTYYDNQRISLIPTMLFADTTGDLLLNGTDVLLLAGSRAFETPESYDSNLIVSPTLSSGDLSYLRQFTASTTTLEQQEGDLTGPFSLALEAQRVTAEGHVSRAVVLGCSTLLTSPQIHAMTDAQEFIIRTVEFLLNTQPTDLGIMARTAVRPALSAKSSSLGSLLLVALPVSVLAAALIVLWPRRYR